MALITNRKDQDFVLYDVFHNIKAHLLYPLNCGCGEDCLCEATRAKIVLSLNVDLYNKPEYGDKSLIGSMP